MIKSIKSITWFIILAFSNSYTYAQMCPNITNTININTVVKEPNVNYNYTSRQLEGIQGSNYSRNKKLGEYRKSNQIGFQTQIAYRVIGNQYCAVIETLNITAQSNSEIYISKEAQSFPCTKNRVLAHEYKHHMFNKEGMNLLSSYGREIASKITNKTYLGNSKEDIDQQIKNKTSVLNKYLLDFTSLNSRVNDEKIDTEQNYKNEQQICSLEENKALMNLLMAGQ